jgi:hypothetical protein
MTVLQFKPRAAPVPVTSQMTTTFTDPVTLVRGYAYIWISLLISPWTACLQMLDEANDRDRAEAGRRGGA